MLLATEYIYIFNVEACGRKIYGGCGGLGVGAFLREKKKATKEKRKDINIKVHFFRLLYLGTCCYIIIVCLINFYLVILIFFLFFSFLF